MFHHFAEVLADAVEGVEPRLLHLERHHLDDDARQLLGQRLAARRLRPLVRGHLGGGRRLRFDGHDELQQLRQRQLLLAPDEALALLADEACLEFPVRFEERHVDALVFVALGLQLPVAVRKRLQPRGQLLNPH